MPDLGTVSLESLSAAGSSRRWLASGRRSVGGTGGYTFVELLVVATIMMILASAIMPLAKVTAHAAARSRAAPRRCARCARRSTSTRTPPTSDRSASLEIKAGSEGYPADLQTLVDGVDGGERRDRAQAEVPAPDSGRSDDAAAPSGGCARTRTSPTRRAGAARTCSTCTRRSRARRSTARNTSTGESGNWVSWSPGQSD